MEVIVYGSNNERVAKVTRFMSDVGIANARLIAAAPDLYDVLNCLACAIIGEANGIPNDLKRQLERATDALAKARGETV